MRILFTFTKANEVRWLGHLDILRTMERAVRRAKLPVAFSEGFNPRERMAFANALSTGATGGAEVAVIELAVPLTPEDFITQLNPMLPRGISVLTAVHIPDQGWRDLLNSYTLSLFEITLQASSPIAETWLSDQVERVTKADALIVSRTKEGRQREVDLRPHLASLNVQSVTGSQCTLNATFRMSQQGTIRPGELADILSTPEISLKLLRAHRVRLLQSLEE